MLRKNRQMVTITGYKQRGEKPDIQGERTVMHREWSNRKKNRETIFWGKIKTTRKINPKTTEPFLITLTMFIRIFYYQRVK